MEALTPDALPLVQILGAWLSIFLTICIFSFLYGDNPIYKLAEHIFLGVSIGYGVVEIYYGNFKPNLINKLVFVDGAFLGGEWTLYRVLLMVPLVMLVLLMMKFTKNFSWLARIPIAFIVAAYAGVKLTGEANARLMTQVAQSIPDLGAVYAEHGIWSWQADGAGVFSSLFLLLGLCACLLHFYFSAPHKKAMKYISRFGVLVLMLSFGASFGYTVMGRISLAIGRAQELLGLDKPVAEAAQIHPKLATLASLIVIITGLVVWRMRGGGADEEAA